MTRRSYCAIIGDIVRSRDLPNRGAVQRKFLRTVGRLNEEFAPVLVADFRFRVREGDSFEGLLRHPAQSYRFVRRLQQHMEGIPFVVGVGAGPLSTPLARNVDVVDGEPFHRARTALALARQSRQEVVFDLDSPSVALLNALVGLMEKERLRLTARQREVLHWMERLGTQIAVARKLKISQPAVSRVMTVPTVRKLIEAEEVVQRFLDAFPE